VKLFLPIIFVASFAATALAVSHPDSAVINKRRQLMKELAAHAKAIGRLVDRPNEAAAETQRRALAMRLLAKEIPALFKPGTGLDAVSSPRTGAKSAIWERWETFEAAARRLAIESDRLRRLATNAGKTQLRLQFSATTMGGCGDCHKTFRKKLD